MNNVEHFSAALPADRLSGLRRSPSLWAQLLSPAEPFNAWSHLGGAVLAAVGTVILVVRATPPMIPGVLIYGLSMVGLLFFSAATHSARDERLADRLEVWDRAMIYVLIAGTYTPLAQGLLSGATRLWLLLAIWIQAAIGIALVWSRLELPRFVSVGFYVAMGWTILVVLPQLWPQIDASQVVALSVGTSAYTLGALVFALRWPNPWKGKVGSHGLWHVAVLVGAAGFFAAVYRLF